MLVSGSKDEHDESEDGMSQILKAYIYGHEELGFPQGFPSGTLRLAGIEQVTRWQDAEVFIVPPSLMHIQDANMVRAFTYMSVAEKRHVFFDVSDFDQTYNGLKCMFIRCNLKKFMREIDPMSIPWGWPVDDFKDCIEPPASGFLHDVSFQAWISTDTRKISSDACLGNPQLKCDFATYKDFYGYVHRDNRPEADRRMAEFKRSMKESRIALCPESIPGVFPYRFFEALSAGRVPLLVSSDYNLPFQDEIPYHEFMLELPRAQAAQAGSFIREFLNRTTDAQLIEMGKKGRHYWERFLNRDDWMKTMAYAVRKSLKQQGLYEGEVGSL